MVSGRMSNGDKKSDIAGRLEMNVLIACEESQAVCKAFRERGHRAFSCDLQECSGGHPEWHIQSDCLPLLNGRCEFTTADTHTHTSGQVGSDNSASTMHISHSYRESMVQRGEVRRKSGEAHGR